MTKKPDNGFPARDAIVAFIRANPGKPLGDHPTLGGVAVKGGRYGAYVTAGGVNATIPSDKTQETITLEEAIALIDERVAKGGGKPKRGAKKAKPAKAAKAEKPAKAAKPAKAEAVAKAPKPAKKAAAKKSAAKPKSDSAAAASKARAPVTATAKTSPSKAAKPVAKKSAGKASG